MVILNDTGCRCTVSKLRGLTFLTYSFELYPRRYWGEKINLITPKSLFLLSIFLKKFEIDYLTFCTWEGNKPIVAPPTIHFP